MHNIYTIGQKKNKKAIKIIIYIKNILKYKRNNKFIIISNKGFFNLKKKLWNG